MSMNVVELIRAIPMKENIIAKLGTGEYTIFGGVVRYSKGMIVDGVKVGGQIVAHIIFPSDKDMAQQAMQSLQGAIKQSLGNIDQNLGSINQGINSLSQGQQAIQASLGVLQALQVANLVMAGLNLAVSVGGFIIVCNKLNAISSKIDQQTAMIAETLKGVIGIQTIMAETDEATFIATMKNAELFASTNDIEQLKNLLQPLGTMYEKNKLALIRMAAEPAFSIANHEYIEAIQERMFHLGLAIAYIQSRTAGSSHSQKKLQSVENDILELSKARIENLTKNEDLMFALTLDEKEQFKGFLEKSKEVIPFLHYNQNLLELEEKYPGILAEAANSEEVLIVAA